MHRGPFKRHPENPLLEKFLHRPVGPDLYSTARDSLARQAAVKAFTTGKTVVFLRFLRLEVRSTLPQGRCLNSALAAKPV